MLAEPLAMQVEGGLVPPEWLSNYRRNLERMLGGSEGFANIDFLPEPFAVFQYYRYGVRYPAVAQQTKYRALVIDFGGGTFDICIIETTKEGDISQTGRNSRPLAASSVPVGGFSVNQVIAEELFRKYVQPQNTKIKKGIEVYKKWKQEQQDLSTSADEYRNFVKNFHEAICDTIENLKLSLCKHITSWRLDAVPTFSTPIALPENPFSADSKFINVQFSANELCSVFISKVWEPRLKPIIRMTLQRGKQELAGAPISVVLLSGGSANIFDKRGKTDGLFSFKAVGYPCTCEASDTNEYSALAAKLVEYNDHDPEVELYEEVGAVQDVSEE